MAFTPKPNPTSFKDRDRLISQRGITPSKCLMFQSENARKMLIEGEKHTLFFILNCDPIKCESESILAM